MRIVEAVNIIALSACVNFCGFIVKAEAEYGYLSAARIIGGQDADHKDYPFLVSIQSFQEAWANACGGSILTPKTVLTAGHCLILSSRPLKMRDPKNFRVVAGITDLLVPSRYRQVRNANKLVLHPDVGRKGAHEGFADAGVIRLDKPLRFNPDVQPVKLYSRDVDSAVAELRRLQGRNAHCFTPGWGLISKKPDKETTSLKVAEQILLTGSACRKTLCPWSETYCIDFDKNQQLCAAAADASVCTGDSGGPLVCNGFLFGVISRGPGCYSGVPQVYTDIVPLLYFVSKYDT